MLRFLQQVQERHQRALERVEELQGLIEKAKNSITECKEREGSAFERGDEREEKVKFLSDLLQTRGKEADESERQVLALKREKDKLLEDIDDFKAKIEETYAEINSLDGLADE